VARTADPQVARAIAALAVAAVLLPNAAAAQDAAYRLQLGDDIGQINRYRLVFDLEMRAEYTGEGALDAGARQLIDALADGMSVSTAVEYDERLMAVDPAGVRTFDVRWHDYQFRGRISGAEIPEPPGRAEATHDLLASSAARVRTSPTGQTIGVEYSNPRLEAFARQFEQAGMPTYLPENAVRVGDSWTGVASFPLGAGMGGKGSMEIDLVHTLKELRQGTNGPVAVIVLSGSYSQLQAMEDVGLGAPLHLDASLTGSTLFDISQGRFVGGNYQIDMFALSAAEGVEIQLTGHATGTLELVDGQ
jgi:hypothetical protein